VETMLLVGGAAQRWHIGTRNVTEAVKGWRDVAPRAFPLPHPSWRNNHWLKSNPWFEAELIPALRAQLTEIL
ncbi:MAG: uracil-DNA glycosylase family protein, partial [Pseudomonadota bacterium]